MLGDKIRNEEAIRPRTVVLLSSQARAASEKVKVCFRPAVSQKKNKRLLAVYGAINSTRQDLLAKRILIPTLSTVEYSSEYLFFISFSTISFELIRTLVYLDENQGNVIKIAHHFNHRRK